MNRSFLRRWAAPALMAAGLLAFERAAAAAAQCPVCTEPSFAPVARAFSTRFPGEIASDSSAGRVVAVGDFNNDGIPDMAVGGSHFLIYLGKGNGAFAPPMVTPYFDARSIVAGDFDGDGNLDLAVALGARIHTFLGDGTGAFPRVYAGPIPSPDGAERIAVGDFDGDGALDLATVPDWGNQLTILRGTGNGTFTIGQNVLVGSAESFKGLALRSADLNGDGIDDIAVSSESDGRVGILLGRSSAVLSVSYVPAFAVSAGDLWIGDFDGDGVPDLAVENSSGNPRQIAILRGNGDGSFQLKNSFGVGYSISFTVGDFNGDGNLDIALYKTYDSDFKNTGILVYPGTGTGNFGPPVATLTFGGTDPSMLVAADLNGDGTPDLVLPADFDFVTVLIGAGDGHFGEAPRILTGIGIRGICSADFNGDGIADVAVSGDKVVVLLGKAGGGLQEAKIVASVTGLGIVSGDFNGDGKPDIAVSSYPGTLLVLPGTGDGTFQAPISSSSDYNISALAAGDFNLDGKLDLVAYSSDSGRLALYPGTGDGRFSSAITVSTLPSQSVLVGDINGDGKPDIVVGVTGLSPSAVRFFPGNGDGTFGVPIDSLLADWASAAALGDFNEDGNLDVVVSYRYAPAVGILLGDGSGAFSSSVFETRRDGRTLAIGDVTGDGHLDVMITSPEGVSVLAGTGDGRLGGSRDFALAGTPTASTVGDFDGDGKTDIAVACAALVYTPPDFVSVMRNTSCEPRRLAMVTNPSGCDPAGSAFPAQPVLRVLDDGDNLVSCDGGAVTAAIASGTGTPGAVLGGSTTVNAMNGVASFLDLSVDREGADYRIRFEHPRASAVRSAKFSVGSAPDSPAAGNNGPVCENETLQLTVPALAGATYHWTGPLGFTSSRREPVIVGPGPEIAGDYHVTETVHGCTSVPATTTVVVKPAPAVKVTALASVCPYTGGLTASVLPVAGVSYAWSIANGTITSGGGTDAITFTSGGSGSVLLSVTATAANGCMSTATKSVTIATGPSCGKGFFTVTPCRVADTRDPAGPSGGPGLAAGTTRAFPVTGVCGIPSSATAVVINMAVVAPTAAGDLRVYPAGLPAPLASSINFRTGLVRSNNATIPLGAGGQLSVQCDMPAGATNFFFDVFGYFE